MFHNNVNFMVVNLSTNCQLVGKLEEKGVTQTTWLGCESVKWPSESSMSHLRTDSVAAQLGWISGPIEIGFISIKGNLREKPKTQREEGQRMKNMYLPITSASRAALCHRLLFSSPVVAIAACRQLYRER